MSTINAVGTSLSGQSGTGAFAGTTSPIFTTPTLGAATATSITFSPTTSGIVGTTTNDNAAAGKVGEVISSSVSTGAITSGVVTNATSISLTAGDWDVYGSVNTNPSGTTTTSLLKIGISSSSVAFPTVFFQSPAGGAAGFAQGAPAPTVRISLSGTTTIYLVAQITYAVSTLTFNCDMYARRAR